MTFRLVRITWLVYLLEFVFRWESASYLLDLIIIDFFIFIIG